MISQMTRRTPAIDEPLRTRTSSRGSGVSMTDVIPSKVHCPNSTDAATGSGKRRIADGRISRAQEEDPFESRRLEAVALVFPQRGALDGHRAGAVVADEEDRATSLVRVVVLDHGAGDLHREQVAVAVDRAAAAPARGATPRRIGAPPD